MKKALILLFVFTMILSGSVGCGTAAAPAPSEEASSAPAADPAESGAPPRNTSEAAAEEVHIITDMDGNQVELPVKVERVVNTWPSSNSTMILIGAGDLLVGTRVAMTTNEWAKLIHPEIANTPANIENVEDLLAMDPDVLIANRVEEEWTNAGLPVVALRYSDYDTMKESMIILGDILGGEYKEKCLRWNLYVDEQIAFVTDRLKDVPDSEKPVVHYVSAHTNDGPASTGSKGSIFDAWTTIAGGVFASSLVSDLADSQQVEITEEALLSTDPDIIVVGGTVQDEVYKELLDNPAWADIKALKEGKVFCSPIGVFPWCRFGMESAMQIVWAAKTFYPDRFEDIDMNQIATDFYKEFNGIELTGKQIENMLAGLPPNA